MDRSLIDDFREKVNDHDMVWKIYHDRNGKNQWSIICSAMDWIDVVVEEIDTSKLCSKNDKHRLTRAHREKQLKMSCQALHNAPPNRT